MTPITIAGAGLAGLCLAQGLQARGIDFDIYERDAARDSRRQGYRIRIDAVGQQALAACLPPGRYQQFLQSCAQDASASRMLDTQLQPVPGRAAEHWDATPDRSADRQLLRDLLMQGLDHRLHFGKPVLAYEESAGHVEVCVSHSSPVRSSLLVAADGVNSVLRQQRLPLADALDTGSACIYGKAQLPLHPELAQGTTVVFAADFAIVVDAMRFDPVLEQAPADYLYWAVIGRRTQLGQDAADSATLLRRLDALASCWSPALRNLFRQSDPASLSIVGVRSAMPLRHWPAGRVTLMGDAIHVMSPAGGAGANTALADAASLLRHLDLHQDIASAVAAYEEDMRQRANAAIQASWQAARRLFGEPALQ